MTGIGSRRPFVSLTHPTAQTEGVQARVGTSGQCPLLARHEIKHLNRYDLPNEYRVSGRTRVAGDGQIDGSLLRWACSSSSDTQCQYQAITPAPGNKIYELRTGLLTAKSVMSKDPYFGFGSFSVKVREGRVGRNAKTGTTVHVPERRCLS